MNKIEGGLGEVDSMLWSLGYPLFAQREPFDPRGT